MSVEAMENIDVDELSRLADEKKYRQLKNLLLEMNSVDIAAFIEDLDSERTVVVFRMLPKDLAAEVFAELSSEKDMHIINSITDRELSDIMEDRHARGAAGDRGTPCAEKYEDRYQEADQSVP